MASVIWTPTAEGDLDDVLYCIAIVDRRPETAERIYRELTSYVQRHAVEKLPGQRYSAAPDGWHYLRFKRWIVFYQPTPSGLEVMRLVDGARDLPRELQ